jgi:hypothetical protein
VIVMSWIEPGKSAEQREIHPPENGTGKPA